MTTETSNFSPLQGIRVLDFSHVIAGPLATFYLAQFGADVLKMESVNGGDILRRSEKGQRGFLALNAGKHCAELDLGSATGQSTALDIAATCDVVVDNLRPGVLERFGLGFEAVRAVNPRVVYCSISGYGRLAGEWSGRPAYDHVIQAATGMAFMSGNEGDAPIKVGFPVVDAATGMQAALAILAALRERDRTHSAVHIDVSMAGAAMQLMYSFACDALTSGSTPERVGNQGFSGSPAADLFATSDGWIALGANTPRQLLRLLNVLELAPLARDTAYFTQPLDDETPAAFVRSVDPARLKLALSERIKTMRAAVLEAQLVECGVPASRLRKLGEFAKEAMDHERLPFIELNGFGTMAISPGVGFAVHTYPSLNE